MDLEQTTKARTVKSAGFFMSLIYETNSYKSPIAAKGATTSAFCAR